MNMLRNNISKGRLLQLGSNAFIVLAAAFTISALAQPTPPPKAQWPKKGGAHKTAIEAFTKALTLASHDAAFRKRLIKPDTAKLAVADVGNIDIPDEEVIIFYENENATPKNGTALSSALVHAPAAPEDAKTLTIRTTDNGRTWLNVLSDIGSNEHYHFFVLPPYDPSSTQTQIYQQWQTGAYQVWWQ